MGSLRQSPEFLGRGDVIGFGAAGTSRSAEPTGGADRNTRLVARPLGCDLDGRRLIGLRCIRIAALLATGRRNADSSLVRNRSR
jgi:hypothetical protein